MKAMSISIAALMINIHEANVFLILLGICLHKGSIKPVGIKVDPVWNGIWHLGRLNPPLIQSLCWVLQFPFHFRILTSPHLRLSIQWQLAGCPAYIWIKNCYCTCNYQHTHTFLVLHDSVVTSLKHRLYPKNSEVDIKELFKSTTWLAFLIL